MLITVERVDDPRLADYLHLKDVNLRRHLDAEHGLFLAEGETVIRRAFASGHRARSCMVATSLTDRIADLVPEDVPTYVVADDLMASVTGFDVHRGAIASMHRGPLPELDAVLAGARRVVVLEDLTNHTNVGAIFRSVAALAADAVLVTPRCADPLYRRAIRVSMGTVFQVPWTRIAPWPAGVGALRTRGFTVAALALTDDAVLLDALAADPPDRLALIFGTEQAGLRPRTRATADLTVRIPMAGGVSSLNVAAAAAVALWALRPDCTRASLVPGT